MDDADNADDTRAVDEVVDYCRTQAGLLAGRVERMAEDANALLDEIDEGVADLRMRLADRSEGDAAASRPESTETPDAQAQAPASASPDVDEIAEAESDLEEKQAMVEATETRMRLFHELATDYLELADTLRDAYDSAEIDADETVRRVVSFEAERDVPAYFEDRETLVEVARRGDAGAESNDPESKDLESNDRESAVEHSDSDGTDAGERDGLDAGDPDESDTGE